MAASATGNPKLVTSCAPKNFVRQQTPLTPITASVILYFIKYSEPLLHYVSIYCLYEPFWRMSVILPHQEM